MPRATRAASKKPIQRAAPYSNTRPAQTASQASDMIMAITVPGMNWDHINNGPYYPMMDSQLQGPFDSYSQHVMSSYQTSLPTPMSGALPVRPLSAPLQMPKYAASDNVKNTVTWTESMDNILLQYGHRMKWDLISKHHLNGIKSGNACRKRHSRLKIERKDPCRWPAEVRNHIVEKYQTLREATWKPLADAVDKPWEEVEQLILSMSPREITGKTGRGHRKRSLQAASRSHRSSRSVSSHSNPHMVFEDDNDIDDGDDDDDNSLHDDSRISEDVNIHMQTGHGQHMLQMQMPPQDYAHRESYQNPITTFPPDDYYRDYSFKAI